MVKSIEWDDNLVNKLLQRFPGSNIIHSLDVTFTVLSMKKFVSLLHWLPNPLTPLFRLVLLPFFCTYALNYLFKVLENQSNYLDLSILSIYIKLHMHICSLN